MAMYTLNEGEDLIQIQCQHQHQHQRQYQRQSAQYGLDTLTLRVCAR